MADKRKPITIQWGRCQTRIDLYGGVMRHLDSPCRVCGEHRVLPESDKNVAKFVNELLDKMYGRVKTQR